MYRNTKDLLELAQDQSLINVILKKEYDLYEKSSLDVYRSLSDIVDVMRASSQDAINHPDSYHGHIIGGDAERMSKYAQHTPYTGEWVNKAMARAFSSSEVNASMGKICAAPTAGSCGILPAALFTAEEQLSLTHDQLLNGMLIASTVGEMITMNATVSGAEGGCQAECGSAAAMAAGMLVYFKGGNNQQIFNASAIALKNVMGLVCDPIAGLVEAPCAKRNASGVVNAMLSADMSLAGVNSIVPFDEVVTAMYKVGRMLPSALKETALGGIATSKTGLTIQDKIFKSDDN